MQKLKPTGNCTEILSRHELVCKHLRGVYEFCQMLDAKNAQEMAGNFRRAFMLSKPVC
jgi:hypothetical protein